MAIEGSQRDPEKTCNTDGCNAWATKQSGRTRCDNCGGKSTGPKTEEGKRKCSGNAEKHGLNSDPLKYKERQSTEESDWIRCVRESILDRMRTQGREPDFLDKALAERIASRMHIAIQAQDYVGEKGLVQTVFVEDGGYEKDIPNGLVKELRQYDESITRDLKKLIDLKPNKNDAEQLGESLASMLSTD